MRRVVFAVLVGCTHPGLVPPEVPPQLPADQVRHYTIWLGGARVGTAVETETWTADGVHLIRAERMRFLRGDAELALATVIDITADRGLVARRVRVDANGSHADAIRDADGWHVDGARLPASAVPAELVPLIVRRDGRFEGTVFLPARGFVVGTGRIEPVAPGRLVARLALDSHVLVEATIDLDRDGAPARIVDGEGVIAIRATATQAAAAFPAADLIAATAVPITGTRRASRLVLDGDLAIPALPGQAARPSANGIELELGAALAGDLPAGPHGPDRRREISAIVAGVRGRITPDLGATSGSARDAAAATAGDCTTFALAYAALAARRAIPTRVVTGLRVDGDRLVRHRWAVSWTGRAWIAVDAAFGAAPAGGDLVGLAIHDADDAGLVTGEAALTQVRAAAWADP